MRPPNTESRSTEEVSAGERWLLAVIMAGGAGFRASGLALVVLEIFTDETSMTIDCSHLVAPADEAEFESFIALRGEVTRRGEREVVVVHPTTGPTRLHMADWFGRHAVHEFFEEVAPTCATR